VVFGREAAATAGFGPDQDPAALVVLGMRADFEARCADYPQQLGGLACGGQLEGWPGPMRIFARRERPHPGAKLSLFEHEDGYRYQLWVTNLPATTRGWRGQNAYIDAGHRVHARVEDCIPARTPGSAGSPPTATPLTRPG
jgi:hypothetical protein